MWKGLIKIIIYMGIVLIPITLRTFYTPTNYQPVIHEIGRNFALIGFPILLLQIVLAGRFTWITRTFGFDIVIRYHKYIAMFAATLLVLHPILLAYGGDNWELLYALDVSWYIWVGKGALLILLIQVVNSAFQESLPLTFEHWRLSHDILAPFILASGFIHVWFVGGEAQSLPARIFWSALLGIAALLFIYHRIVRPVLLARHPYTVTEVIQETPDVCTVKLAPPEGNAVFDYQPGQFQFLTLHRNRGLPEEEHHWTISSSPANRKIISSTIKALGDFTATIGQTQPGDTAVVHAPFGRFSYTFHPDEQDLIFLAGGIGITPLMSMIRHLRDTRAKRNVVLLYGNKTEQEITFRDELAEIEQGDSPSLTVVHVLEQTDKTWKGETGFIDRDKILRFCGEDTSRKGYYVCGPVIFLEKIIAALKELGVPDRRIHQEIFSLLA